jgi:hypothetical protein
MGMEISASQAAEVNTRQLTTRYYPWPECDSGEIDPSSSPGDWNWRNSFSPIQIRPGKSGRLNLLSASKSDFVF